MESAVINQILNSVIHRTLHAHSFSRSSNQASLVLSDLLSRYLVLLTTTCARYSEHGGRTSLTVRDALAALEEMGVTMEELQEYASIEGKEMNRYATQTARRVDELVELRHFIQEGLRQDKTDSQLLRYLPIKKPEDGEPPPVAEPELNNNHPSPILAPPSPISNPSSPTRKRPRSPDWDESPDKRPKTVHPPHIPVFFPPFPGNTPLTQEPPQPVEEPSRMVEQDRRRSPPPMTTISTSTADFRSAIPYEQSTLSTVPEWHLPDSPVIDKLQPKPSSHRALLTAYHFLLSDPTAMPAPTTNPARHNLAMSFLSSCSQPSAPVDTIFSLVTPSPPRNAVPLPSHPKAVDPLITNAVFPSLSRPALSGPPICTPTSSHGSRLETLARKIVSAPVLERTLRSIPPPLQYASSGQPALYGAPVPAPWNTIFKDGPSEKTAVQQPSVPDANLLATWSVDTKDFKQALPLKRSKLAKVAS